MSKPRFTKEQRAEAIEILRCAFDQRCVIIQAALDLGHGTCSTAFFLAEDAFMNPDVPYPGVDGGYLDAAILLEEGWEP